MTLSQDFKEFLQSLNDNQVRYLIVGGYAVALHGHPRYTKDIDIWLWLDPQNAQKTVQALNAFGFASLNLKADDFLEPDTIVQLGYPPNRIDILNSLSGVDFEMCYPSHIDIQIGDLTLPFIDLENLKKNKQASGRMQDLADVENLS
ncbi:DUF6036 family nucleotidyltransferase [Armatimonas sp.]|uniref:DUF6036 family nucleotidyltransferase n=1 Tax=Armatimonas sp. TaxID=1872638 RepID=UPI00286D3840|nr:DUF6036 family nucleotidyltransferase [Armatimonas sp.]